MIKSNPNFEFPVDKFTKLGVRPSPNISFNLEKIVFDDSESNKVP